MSPESEGVLLQRVIEIVVDAGRIIEEIRERGFAVDQKGAQGPVTDADRAADAHLKRRLLELESCGWLSEETSDDPSRVGKARLWIADPLDGTKEFVRGMPEYAVSVALVEAGEPVLGVVHNPWSGDVYAAERGSGTTKNGAAVHTANGGVILASRSEIRRGEFDEFAAKWEIRPVGSIAYKLALIAGGEAAVTLSRGPKWEWDVAAGALLVREAGGRVSDVFGDPFTFNQSFPKVKGVLAGAPPVVASVLAQIAALGMPDRLREFDGLT